MIACSCFGQVPGRSSPHRASASDDADALREPAIASAARTVRSRGLSCSPSNATEPEHAEGHMRIVRDPPAIASIPSYGATAAHRSAGGRTSTVTRRAVAVERIECAPECAPMACGAASTRLSGRSPRAHAPKDPLSCRSPSSSSPKNSLPPRSRPSAPTSRCATSTAPTGPRCSPRSPTRTPCWCARRRRSMPRPSPRRRR